MMVAVRRAVAGLALGLAVGFGAGTAPAHAASPSPTAGATATASGKATASASASPISEVTPDDGTVDNSPDVAPDNTNQVIALGAAGALALVAAVVVFARRT